MIIRVQQLKREFTILPNRILEDARLTFRAKGLLAYLLSRPPNWKCRSNHLQTVSREGRDAVRGTLKALAKYGYARLVTKRDKKTGRINGREWLVFEKPRTPKA